VISPVSETEYSTKEMRKPKRIKKRCKISLTDNLSGSIA
jgi:hypothetical protein